MSETSEAYRAGFAKLFDPATLQCVCCNGSGVLGPELWCCVWCKGEGLRIDDIREAGNEALAWRSHCKLVSSVGISAYTRATSILFIRTTDVKSLTNLGDCRDVMPQLPGIAAMLPG